MQTIFVVEQRSDGLNFILTSPVLRVSSNRAPMRCPGWGRRPPRRQEAEVQRRWESISGEPRWRSYSPRAHEWQENKLNDVVGLYGTASARKSRVCRRCYRGTTWFAGCRGRCFSDGIAGSSAWCPSGRLSTDHAVYVATASGGTCPRRTHGHLSSGGAPDP